MYEDEAENERDVTSFAYLVECLFYMSSWTLKLNVHPSDHLNCSSVAFALLFKLCTFTPFKVGLIWSVSLIDYLFKLFDHFAYYYHWNEN